MDQFGHQENQGLCLLCAKELKLPQIEGIMKQMGIESDEELENVVKEMTDAMNNMSEEEADTLISDEGNTNTHGEKYESNTQSPNMGLGKIFNLAGNQDVNPDKGNDAKNAEKKTSDKKGANQEPKYKALATFATDLVDKATNGLIDNVVGRERELARVIQIINRRNKNNPVLIGEPGVGKTAIAEALALKISKGDIPFKLKDKRIMLLDLTAMVAGTQFRGQFEARMKALIDDVKAAKNVILVIDELHNIMGAGEAEGAMNAANILKPALARGEVQVIGTTTLKEYRKYIEKDGALERRFQPVYVNEPSVEESIEIVKGIRQHYEEYHKVRISDSICEDAVKMSERYITDRFLPDKAIDVIDEACSKANLRNTVLKELAEFKKKLEENEAETIELERKTSEGGELANVTSPDDQIEIYKKTAELKSEHAQLSEKVKELEEKQYVDLIYDDIANVIETWTGIPLSSISRKEAEKLISFEEDLNGSIIGQDEAVSAVAKAIRRNRSGFRKRYKPSSFIFVGPTGVGKTELAKQLTIRLFGTVDALVRFDMSEFMEKHTVSKLIGSPPGYVGYDEAGQLTEKVRRRPYSVILFDEIEKAHPDVFNMLLQILDDGRLTDSQGRTVNFENTVIIMSSNAGNSLKSTSVGFGESGKEERQTFSMDALKSIFRPEFLNRVDEIVVFNQLSRDSLKKISELMINEVRSECKDRGITLEVSDEAIQWFAVNGYDEKYGARPLRRLIQRKIEDELAEMYLKNELAPGAVLSVSVKDNDILLSRK